MKFIKPSQWITPDANMNSIGDVAPYMAHIGTFLQVITYPIAAAVSGIGVVTTRSKEPK